MSEHRKWVIDTLGDDDHRTLEAAGIDLLHMRQVSQTPIVIETCGGGNAIVSYGYVTLVPVSELEPLLNGRRPAISEALLQSPTGILTRLRAWLRTHISTGGAR
ncbi:hypothetical protein [Bifidobacterium pseudolongum]|uniref:Uncharacterized protein n=1 Tax=Bifidobacterium pseudolongum TaxID=1694 RepID=A0A395XEB9_9BIFI|nr:hypothetical protein [Bifidobacterium pseudolongum]RGW07001.1 hypothetical protein DWV92_09290 [Bifidobacterium pseudolongum]